jgi:hypothetical protein
MRLFAKVGLALGLAALCAAPAPAQFYPYLDTPTGAMLLLSKSIQDDLKLDASQKSDLQKIVRDTPAKFKTESDQVNKEIQAANAKSNQLTTKVSEETAKEIAKALKPEQLKRAKQFVLQRLGLNAFNVAEVQAALRLSGDQKKDIKTITDDVNKETTAIRTAEYKKPRPDYTALQKKLGAMHKAAVDKAVAKLTDDQKKTWKELAGDPFKGLEMVINTYISYFYTPKTIAVDSYLFYNQTVIDELKLRDDEKRKILNLPTVVYNRYTVERNKINAESRKAYAKQTALQKKITDETRSALGSSSVLKADQASRFKQIMVQMMGAGALSDKDVQSALRLTDEQKKDVAAMAKTLADTIARARRATIYDYRKQGEVNKLIEILNQRAQAKMLDKLTEDQKKVWKDLTGTPFIYVPDYFGTYLQ